MIETAFVAGFRDPALQVTSSLLAMSSTLELKAIPNAPRTELAGWLGGVLKVKVHAPALDGRANDELLDFLASKLDVHRRDLSLLRGDKSRQKVVRISGLDATAVRKRLSRGGT